MSGRTSPAQRAALRARYTPEPVPGCPHCGGKRALAWAFEPRLQMHLFRCATPECRERRPDTDTLASTGDRDVLALCDDADALAGARATVARLRTALETIQQWDCLNPPNAGLCADFPWLRELVDTALAPGMERVGE